MTARVIHADCRDTLRLMDESSVDAIVTDPPYELGFMGKRWDATGIAYSIDLWRECLRVLKPGGHLLAFGGTRTSHRMACAIEDAGFEIRDSIHWLYGSGFPKSLDVSKAIDKAAGAERPREDPQRRAEPSAAIAASGFGADGWAPQVKEAATEDAARWQGWGTALKPAHEPIVVARKPLVGTVAGNVLEHGTGALNIDGCRVGYASDGDKAQALAGDAFRRKDTSDKGWSRPWMDDPDRVARMNAEAKVRAQAGRWPANVVIDDTIADAHPEWGRYFYCAKPSKVERNAGLDGLPEGPRVVMASGGRTMKDGVWVETHSEPQPRANHHPTVKPVALMRWLVRLVTPPGGTVLDPFTGSGTTLVAAILEGVNAIGIEMTDDYLPIIEGRIAWAEQQPRDLFGGAA